MRAWIHGLFLCAAVSRAVAGLDAPAEAALRDFTSRDCEVGSEGVALSRLLEHATAVQGELIRILREGPDAVTAAELQIAAEEAWSRRAAFLASNPPLGLSPESLLAVHAVAREPWIEARVAREVEGMRERAAIGLAAIGVAEAILALQDVRRGAGPELRSVIESALARIHADKARMPARGGRAGIARPKK
jgi:hypothetical protein